MTLNDLTDSQLQITNVTVELPVSSSKLIESIDIEVDAENVFGQVRGQAVIGASRTLAVVLDPFRVVRRSLRVKVHLRYRNILGGKLRSDGSFSINLQDLLATLNQGIGDVTGASRNSQSEWRGKFGKLTVIVGLAWTRTTHPIERAISIDSMSQGSSEHGDGSKLTPTTETILRDGLCFRILVMGKTGVGKSSLINKTFGVNDAIVEHHEAGFADINKEIYSKENPHFILHDSKGFQQGDDVNVNIVRHFIDERREMPHIKDKLHAIWLCIEIPMAGGRLLETGVEKFLKLKIEGKLGNVPVIVVFTKYDRLIVHENRLLRRADHAGKSKEAIANLIQQNANVKLQDNCVKPFERFVESKVPHITVSTEPGYEDRLSNLIQITYELVRDYLADASVVSAMAQQVSPRVNIQASIEVGRRKYWQRLATSVNFSGKTLQQCLDVIHADIIAVWRFNDPKGYLSSDQFKAMMSNIVVADSDQNTSRNPGGNLSTGVGLVAGLAGIITTVGPVGPIVIPIAASLVVARWVYKVYQQATVILRLLMTWIIDLTLILQNLFWLQMLADPDCPLSRRIINLAVHIYKGSTTKRTLSFKIDEHLQGVSFNWGPDTTLNKIVELIEMNIIDSAEMMEHRGSFSLSALVGDDEAWEM